MGNSLAARLSDCAGPGIAVTLHVAVLTSSAMSTLQWESTLGCMR